jgi:hypothetical protein
MRLVSIATTLLRFSSHIFEVIHYHLTLNQVKRMHDTLVAKVYAVLFSKISDLLYLRAVSSNSYSTRYCSRSSSSCSSLWYVFDINNLIVIAYNQLSSMQPLLTHAFEQKSATKQDYGLVQHHRGIHVALTGKQQLLVLLMTSCSEHSRICLL